SFRQLYLIPPPAPRSTLFPYTTLFRSSPLVGRTGELLLLRQALDRVVRERGCHLFTLLGPAGIGKTRLVEEFLSGLGDEATVLRSEEHTSELQSPDHLVCRLLLEKKKQ